MPRTLSYIQRISFLFPHSIESWPIYYIQGLPIGEKEWITLPEEDYFRLKPFGYRTRLHQFLYRSKDLTGYSKGQQAEHLRHKELAHWIVKRYAELHKQNPPLVAVRFVAAFYVVKQQSSYDGHWRKPPLDFFPVDRTYILSTHFLENEKSL